jgi:3-oxoacyl-[acyl-carrier protein] reductase
MKTVITGGQSDIGKAIAAILPGAVSLPGRKELDVTRLFRVKQFFQAHKPHIVVNCAGYIEPETVAESDPTLWFEQINVNLLGTYYCAKYALQNGANLVINIASTAGREGRAGWSAYCASKAGVISLTQSLAAEGVDAYCIIPGRTKTKMRARLFPNENESTLLQPVDIANVVKRILEGEFHGFPCIVVKKNAPVEIF